jgi:hypothetical protein
MDLVLWNNLMCLDYSKVKTLPLKVYGLNHGIEGLRFQTLIMDFFYFVKISKQMINSYSKF